MKPDSHLIVQKINELKSGDTLTVSQRWWPNYLFHFTDVTNVAGILNSGQILSRSEIAKEQIDFKDIASPKVLSKTDDKWKDYVRLYFRPKTPMQFSIEGVRPEKYLEHGGAHCPVPVFLLFESVQLLCQKDTIFSNGNLSSNKSDDGDTGEFFINMPFEKIYHTGSLHELGYFEKRAVIRNRQAEILTPNKLGLESLRAICCRSVAEMGTLHYLMSDSAYENWKNKIAVSTRADLFNERWLFVKNVSLNGSRVTFNFNTDVINNKPFSLELKITCLNRNKPHSWQQSDMEVRENISFDLNSVQLPFEVKLFINSHLAFSQIFEHHDDEIPF